MLEAFALIRVNLPDICSLKLFKERMSINHFPGKVGVQSLLDQSGAMLSWSVMSNSLQPHGM